MLVDGPVKDDVDCFVYHSFIDLLFHSHIVSILICQMQDLVTQEYGMVCKCGLAAVFSWIRCVFECVHDAGDYDDWMRVVEVSC